MEPLPCRVSPAGQAGTVPVSTRGDVPMGSVAQCLLLAPWCQRNLKVKDHGLDAKLLKLVTSSWGVVSAFHSVCLGEGKEDLGCSNEGN